MDSSAYKAFIQELQNRTPADYGELPIPFVKEPMAFTLKSMESCVCFLDLVLLRRSAMALDIPAILLSDNNPFSQVFSEAHVAISEIAHGSDPDAHSFRNNGRQLVRLLSFCAQGHIAQSSSGIEIVEAAMFCFLLEGLTNAGWCPNAYEGTAKRAAHAWFLAVRKSMHRCPSSSVPAILGYLCCAWILAQKTEGILDADASGKVLSAETFQWISGRTSYFFLGCYDAGQTKSYLLDRNAKLIANPFTRFVSAGKVGLRLYVDDCEILPEGAPETADIARPSSFGTKLVYQCNADHEGRFLWTVVFLWFKGTTYRIDNIRADRTISGNITGELRIENDSTLVRKTSDTYLGLGVQNTVVRLVENALHLDYTGQEVNGLSCFKSMKSVHGEQPVLRNVCAWASAKGISTINETKLLGIYDTDW
jgi:hypothetical protein